MYKKGIKRVFSLFLSIALVLSLFVGISFNVNAEEEYYTIKFDGNGGSGTQDDLKISKDANSVTIPNCEFKRDGYTFVGWKCDRIPMDYLISPQEITPSTYSMFKSVLFNSGDTVTFVAQWQDTSKTYSISFNANGGSGSQAPITGITYDKLSTTIIPQSGFTRKGYTFDRWTTNPDGTGMSIQPNTPISSYWSSAFDASGNLTLYAQWVDANRKFNVVFDGNGATSGTTESMTGLTSDQLSITMPQCGYKKDGYTFVGWTTSPGNNTGSTYSSSPGSVYHLSTMSFYQSDTITFYAVWWDNNKTFTINFNGNGGTGTTASLTGLTVEQIKNVKIPQCDFTRDGYVFTFWSKSYPYTSLYEAGSIRGFSISDFNESGELTLNAQWQDDIKKYTINFDGNGNGVKGNVAPISVTYSQFQKGVTIPDNGYSWAGHTFRGWNTKKDGSGTMISYISQYSINSLFTQSDEVTLYAQWWDDNKTYTASFDGNDATSGTMQAISGLKRTSYIQLPECKYKKTGYEFAGWTLNSNGTGQVIQPGEIIKLSNYNYRDNANVNFYAKWVDNSKKYGITFNANGGSGTMTAASGITVGENYIIPKSNFTKSGYTFKNWNTKADGSGYTISPGAYLYDGIISNLFGSSNKTTLYAQWANNSDSWTIKYNGNGATSGTVAPTTGLKRSSTFTVPQCGFKKTGYTFAGWNTKSDGTGMLLQPGSTIYNGNSFENIFGKAGTYNLYAQWVKDDGARYQFTYDGNNPTSGAMSVDKNLIADSTYKIPVCQYKKTGYSFECWNTKKDGTGRRITPGMLLSQSVAESGYYFEPGNNTLYAQWVKVDENSKKTIIFDKNGGTGSMASMTISPGEKAFFLPVCSYTKKGYVPYGWNTKPDGTGLYIEPGIGFFASGEDAVYRELFTGTNTVTLYPIWAVSVDEANHDCSKDGHTYGAPTYKWSDDGKTCTAIRVCQNDPSHIEKEVATVGNKKVALKVTKNATCTTAGTRQYVATFSNKAFKAQVNSKKYSVAINKNAHKLGTVTYKWSADGKTCTATRVCANNKNHKETETVKATATVAKKATATAMGQTRYTAKFKNAAFKQQTITKTDVKITQPMKVVSKATSKKPASIKYTSLRSKNQTVLAKNLYSVAKVQGKVSCKKISGNANIAVATNGNIIVKKGLKRGLYGVKVRVTAAGNAKYKAGYKDVVVYVKVQ